MTEKDTRRPRKHPGIRIPKASGENAIRYLTDQHLIDRSLKVDSSNSHVFLPLTKKLSDSEKKGLRERFGLARTQDHIFPDRPRQYHNLRDAVKGKIPDQLLESLPSSYDIIGDIAVLDLPVNMSNYETALAEGIRLINKNISVVLAKTGAITGKERILPTRHIAGEDRTTTIHKESGCLFKVDISKAFFSPRLSREHERVAEQVEPEETVTDLFAGVGPFSIMIAKRQDRVEVNAVDSNPNAIRLLQENLALNKITGRVNFWTGDAREVVENNLSRKASRVIMNNPSVAQTFVDVACNALTRRGGIIHYYTFSEGQDCEAKAVAELEAGLHAAGWRARWVAESRRVREVAPMKWQVVIDAPVAPLD